MDHTNQTFINQTELSNIYQILTQMNGVLYNYISRTICGLGFITNLFFLFVYSNKKLKGIYSYQFCHCLCNLVVCFIGSFYSPFLQQKTNASYFFLIFNFFVYLPLRIALIASGYSDVLRILNRYLFLKKKKIFLSELSKLKNLGCCLGFGTVLLLPVYFAIKIVKSKSKGKFYWEFNEIGLTKYFTIYLLALLLIEIVIPLVILTILNIRSIRFYQEDRLVRQRLQIMITEIRKKELRFTRTVLLLNIILIASRGLDMITTLMTRIVVVGEMEISRDSNILLDLSRTISLSILFFVHAFESFIYLKMDKNIKQLVAGFFKCKQVKLTFLLFY